MGRTIVYDSGVQACIEKLLLTKQHKTCLIIGQHTVQRDIVVHLCAVPPKDVPSVPDPICSDQSASASDKKQQSKKQKSDTSSAGLELEELWISHFAKEVTRTLPGGFEILGLFVIVPSEEANKLQQKLKQALFSIFKVLGKDLELSICNEVKDRLLLHLCSVSKKFVCRTYDVSNIKSTPNPAEWKQLPSLSSWLTLRLQLSIEFKFAVSADENTSNVKRQIDAALSPFFENVLEAVPMVDELLREPSEMLLFVDGKKTKQKHVHSNETYNVDLLMPQKRQNVHSKTSSYGLMLTFKGTIHCRSFVHGKATVQEAVKAMKQDVIRSITSRIEIHCEDLLVIDEEHQDPVVVYELPKRVFAPLVHSGIQVCDYQFHGDTAKDSLTAFKEILNLDLTEHDIESCELSPATSDLIQSEVMEDRLSEFGDVGPPQKSILFPVASAAVAAVAAGLSYFFLLQDT